MCIHINFPAPAPYFTLLLLCKFYHHHASPLFLLLLLSLFFPATAQQPISPSSPQDSLVANMRFDKTIASVLVILVMVIFSLGFILIYTRQCRERRIRGRIDLTVPINGNGCRPPHGLDPKIIENFPSFVYLEVKNHKIGRVTLECCVCLNEFKDDETLRLITNCSHVFHRDCVDAWLLHHSTCPVCRADLDLGPGDDSLSVEIPILDTIVEPNLGELVFNRERDVIEPVDLDDKKKIGVVNSIVHYDGMNCPVRSKSTGFMFARLFSPSNSMDQLMVQSNQDCERFTLRLPNEVHNRLVNDITLTRAKSLGGTLSSGRSGYRTKSVGRSFLRYEQLNVESHSKKRGFMGVPRSFLSRVGSIRSTKDGNKATTMELMDEIYVGERSLNRLVSNN